MIKGIVEKKNLVEVTKRMQRYCDEHEHASYNNSTYVITNPDGVEIAILGGLGNTQLFAMMIEQDLLSYFEDIASFMQGAIIFKGVHEEYFHSFCKARSDVDIRLAPKMYMFHNGCIDAYYRDKEVCFKWYGNDPEVKKHALAIAGKFNPNDGLKRMNIR